MSASESSDNSEKVSRWVIYGVSKNLRNEVKIYALRQEITIAEALEEIISLWLNSDKKSNDK